MLVGDVVEVDIAEAVDGQMAVDMVANMARYESIDVVEACCCCSW